jgi:hypothetical protein
MNSITSAVKGHPLVTFFALAYGISYGFYALSATLPDFPFLFPFEHAAQSFFVILNDGITIGQQTWLMAGVYLAAAVIITIAAGPSFARKPAQAIDAAPAAHGSANRSAGLLLEEFSYIRVAAHAA